MFISEAVLHAVASELGFSICMLLIVIMIPWEKIGWPPKKKGPWDKK